MRRRRFWGGTGTLGHTIRSNCKGKTKKRIFRGIGLEKAEATESGYLCELTTNAWWDKTGLALRYRCKSKISQDREWKY
jgi:hypothetical protein